MSVVNGVVVAMAPPDDYVVDFDNPQRNLVVTNYCVAGIGMLFSCLFLAQRLFVRMRIHHTLGIDDYCVIIAWVGTIAMQALIIRGFVKGYNGTHIWEMPLAMFAEFAMYATYVQAIVYVIPTLFSKVALLIFYMKLGNSEQWFKWAIWFTLCVVVGSNVGLFFSIMFACKPISKGWDITVQGGECIDQPAVFKATAAFGIVTDVLIFAIPIPMVIKLHISRRKKIGLFILFAIGSATVVTSIVRLDLLVKNLSAADISWLGGPVFAWICVEANLLVICACLPTVKYFVQQVAPTLLGSSYAKSNSNTAAYGSNFQSGAGLSSNRTPRPKPRRNQYQGFDDDEDDTAYRMETLVGTGTPVLKDANWQDQRSSGDKDRDDDSAKAIIQTQTVRVEYESREGRLP